MDSLLGSLGVELLGTAGALGGFGGSPLEDVVAAFDEAAGGILAPGGVPVVFLRRWGLECRLLLDLLGVFDPDVTVWRLREDCLLPMVLRQLDAGNQRVRGPGYSQNRNWRITKERHQKQKH